MSTPYMAAWSELQTEKVKNLGAEIDFGTHAVSGADYLTVEYQGDMLHLSNHDDDHLVYVVRDQYGDPVSSDLELIDRYTDRDEDDPYRVSDALEHLALSFLDLI